MSFTLRPYQSDLISQARDLIRAGEKSILIQAPTGSGKTALTAHMLGSAAERDHQSWFVVHRRELVRQSARTFYSVGIPHGIVASGFQGAVLQPVQICSVQTLAQRHTRMRRPKLIVWDECHHVAAASWAKIHEAYPDAIHIGLSATPERLDGTGLISWFKNIITGPSVSSLIDDGFLAPYRLFAPSRPDLGGVHTRMGDFVRSEAAAVMDKPSITGDAVAHYRKLAAGKRAVVFCTSIEHSQHVVAQFRAAGFSAEHVDGETNPHDRDAALRRFESGETLILSNVELFGEGVDIPGIEVAILLRPTQSLSLYLQQVGRALRPAPGKTEAIILDHAGNALRHGLPDDDRAWSLDGSKKKRKARDAADVPVKQCPKCFSVVRSQVMRCVCGHQWIPQGREVNEVAGELQEVDPSLLRRQKYREQASAKSLDDLIRLGAARGYRNPRAWALHVFQARNRA
jgi:superfamily II DNA or RNA helicase|nr:MAG TPA: Type I site specific restriction modification protein [Caudoviricetes sp.]